MNLKKVLNMTQEDTPRTLSHKKIKKIRNELNWINKTAKDKLQKYEPRLDSLSRLLRGNLNNYFPDSDIHNLKIALYSFHMYCEQYKISSGLSKLLIRLSINSKANLILKHTKKLAS